MWETITPLVTGAVGGLGWGMMGYLKHKAREGKKIDFLKAPFVRAGILGAIAGGVAAYSGVPIAASYETIGGLVMLTAVVDTGAKIIARTIANIAKRFA